VTLRFGSTSNGVDGRAPSRGLAQNTAKATLATNDRAAHSPRTEVRPVAPLLRRPAVLGWKALASGAVLGVLATRLLACTPAPASRASAGPDNVAPDGSASLHVLVFSATAGYRHASIPDGIAALTTLAGQRGWTLTATEDATQFQDSVLSMLDVIVFLSTTGDVLDTDQQAALVRYVQSGKGWVGIHSASDTEHDWPWYGGLVGAYFQSHPDIQQAAIHVEDPTFPATSGLPDPWVRTDEWYAFTSNPRGRVHVLLSLDEDSYAPGDSGMDGDHPIAWYQVYEGGRSFYTALGHTSESYQEPLFVAQLAEAVEWAGGR
jgi:cytochrome c